MRRNVREAERRRYTANNSEHDSQQPRGNSRSSATTVSCSQSHCDDSFTEGTLQSRLPGAHPWDCIQGWGFRQDQPGWAHKVALLFKAWLPSVRSERHTGRWASDTSSPETTLQECLIGWNTAANGTSLPQGQEASTKVKQHDQIN